MFLDKKTPVFWTHSKKSRKDDRKGGGGQRTLMASLTVKYPCFTPPYNESFEKTLNKAVGSDLE